MYATSLKDKSVLCQRGPLGTVILAQILSKTLMLEINVESLFINLPSPINHTASDTMRPAKIENSLHASVLDKQII